MKCIRSEVFSDNANIPDSLTEEEINSLYVLSKKHDLAHALANALINNGLLTMRLSVSSSQSKSFYRFTAENNLISRKNGFANCFTMNKSNSSVLKAR